MVDRGHGRIVFQRRIRGTLATVEPVDDKEEDGVQLNVSVLRGAAHRYDQTLDKTLRSAVVPYGYTVTIWASGAYLISLRGIPGLWEAFAFVAGALAAFGLLSALSQRRPGTPVDTIAPPIHPDSSHPIFAAGLHIAAVGLAFLAAGVVDELLGNAAWFFGSFAVTLIYLSIASAELAIAVELNQRRVGPRRAATAARRAVSWRRRPEQAEEPAAKRPTTGRR